MIDLNWFDLFLVCVGLALFGLFGLIWADLVCCDFGLLWFGLMVVWLGLTCFDLVWFCLFDLS